MCMTGHDHIMYIMTVSSQLLLSTLPNQFKLVYRLFGQRIIDHTLDFRPNQTNQEGIEQQLKTVAFIAGKKNPAIQTFFNRFFIEIKL